jgi:hypothetical protein
MKVALLPALTLLLAACSSSTPGVVATVDGVEVSEERLAALNVDGVDATAEERASSLYLLILHGLLSEGAEADFGYAAGGTELAEAFDRRTGGIGDVDARLAERGVTRDRVMLEAELDLIRSELERELVYTDGYGFDFEEAYRGFLAVNSNVCMAVLNLADATLVPEVQAMVDAGDDLDDIFETYPDRTARIDMGCTSPIDHGDALAPVALDGEVGVSYARPSGDGAIFVAKVTSRDAPSADEVRDEVMAFGVENQGPELFNLWAVEQLSEAEVTVDADIGRWRPGPDTGDVPTIIPAG